MRIVYLTDSYPPFHSGGAGVVVHNLAVGLQKKGYEVYVISVVPRKEDIKTVLLEGVTVHFLYSKYPDFLRAYFSLWNPKVIFAVRKLLAEIKPDVVHAHNIHTHISYAALEVARDYTSKVFLTFHDVMAFAYGKLVDYYDKKDLSVQVRFDYKISFWYNLIFAGKRFNPFRNLVIRHYLHCAKLLAVSYALKDALVSVLYNGIDVSLWSDDVVLENKFRQKFNLLNKKVILFGGRVTGAKGSKVIVEALSIIVKKVPTTVLLVVGKENKATQEMLRYATKLGIQDHIVFTGWLTGEALAVVYRVSDVVVVPSLCFDSLPTVILEAMATKKPVVATCFGGAPEMVQENKTGYIVNPNNISLLVEKISNLLIDSKMAHAFGVDGYTRVNKEFGLEKQITQTLQLYIK